MKEVYVCKDCMKLVVLEDLKTKYSDDIFIAEYIAKTGLCEDCFGSNYPFLLLNWTLKRLNNVDTFKPQYPREVYECGCNQNQSAFYSAIPIGKYKFMPNDILKATMYKEEPKMFISRKPYGGETYKCCKCGNNFQEGAATFYREGTNDPIVGITVMSKSNTNNRLYLCPDCIEGVFEALGKAVQIGDGK